MKQIFKEGDWCFCEFTLQQVGECSDDGRIRSVTDGSFRLSGHDLSDRCFPLELDVKRISDTVAYWSREFHKLNHNGLNHPDLNRELISRWVEMCESRAEPEIVKALSEKLSDFASAVVSQVKALRTNEVDGVRLFRN